MAFIEDVCTVNISKHEDCLNAFWDGKYGGAKQLNAQRDLIQHRMLGVNNFLGFE